MRMRTSKPLPTYDNYSGDKHSSEDKCYELPVSSGSQNRWESRDTPELGNEIYSQGNGWAHYLLLFLNGR